MTKYFYIENSQITPEFGDIFINHLNTTNEDIIVMLKSPGGNPYIARNLYEILKKYPYETTVYGFDQIDSAAVVFYLGFKNRYITPNSSFLVHPTSTERDNFPESINAYNIQPHVNLLKSTDDMTIDIILSEIFLTENKEMARTVLFNMILLNTRIYENDAKLYKFINDVKNLPDIDQNLTIKL